MKTEKEINEEIQALKKLEIDPIVNTPCIDKIIHALNWVLK